MKYSYALVCRSTIAGLLALTFMTKTHATTVTIDAEYRGNYDQYGSAVTAVTSASNYFTGVYAAPDYNNGVPVEIRNFFSFDVGGKLGYPGAYNISAAKVVLDNWNKEIGVIQPNGSG